MRPSPSLGRQLSLIVPLVQLAEALLTLANLTVDENAREELYARAQTEGGDTLALELDPPSTAFPAAISSIGTTTAKLAACTTPVEASPSLLFATGLLSGAEPLGLKREPR